MPYRIKDVKALTREVRHNYRTQLNQLRCSNPEQIMGDNDSVESDNRYLDSLEATESKLRRRSQSRIVGVQTEGTED